MPMPTMVRPSADCREPPSPPPRPNQPLVSLVDNPAWSPGKSQSPAIGAENEVPNARPAVSENGPDRPSSSQDRQPKKRGRGRPRGPSKAHANLPRKELPSRSRRNTQQLNESASSLISRLATDAARRPAPAGATTRAPPSRPTSMSPMLPTAPSTVSPIPPLAPSRSPPPPD